MTGRAWHRGRRAGAGAAAVLALLGGPVSAGAVPAHVPTYRYYVLARVDDKPHPISGTVIHHIRHRDSVSIEWVVESRGGRRRVFDRAYTGGSGFPSVAAGEVGSPRCIDPVPCAVDHEFRSEIRVPWAVSFDFFIAVRDGDVRVELPASVRKHWVFTELTGDARTTGRLHVRMPSDGDVTSVHAPVSYEEIRDIGYPGGRYGSVATARSVWAPNGVTRTGSAVLDGGQHYVQDVSRLEKNVQDVTASHTGPTFWRLHGDLRTVGVGAGPVLLVYDLPEPGALRAFLRRR